MLKLIQGKFPTQSMIIISFYDFFLFGLFAHEFCLFCLCSILFCFSVVLVLSSDLEY
jgi:hypothetical protein